MMAKRILFCVFLGAAFLALSACAPMVGPNGAKGTDAVVASPVASSGGNVQVADPSGGTFFIKCRDTTGKAIDLGNRLTQLLTASGKTAARREDDAYYVIDIVLQNFEDGKETPTTGVVDTGDPLLNAMIVSGLPNFCSYEADIVIDELKPEPEPAKKGGHQKSKKQAQPQQPESIQTKTVLSCKAKYAARKATEDDAVGVIADNMAKFIDGMLK
jgi:hypothetical protein